MQTTSVTDLLIQPTFFDAPASKSKKAQLPKVKSPVDFWHAPAVIAENHFVYKSLSNWAFNVAVGCSHACRFCYVPSAATIKQGPIGVGTRY